MSLAEKLTILRKRVEDQDKEIRRLKEENERCCQIILTASLGYDKP